MTEAVVAVAAYPGMQALDAVGPFEVFAAANTVLDASGGLGDRYRPVLASVGGPLEVATESGLTVTATATLDELDAIDTLVVPGGDGVRAVADDVSAIAAVRRAGALARRRVTVCSGAFIGAEAGWFEPGWRVTTHWARADALARRHPELVVDPDPVFVRNGDTWTSAGVTAGIDLALALVEDDHGGEIAQTIARWFVVFLRRPGGQSQFAAPVWSRPAERPPVRAAVDLIHADPAGRLDLSRLAAHAGVSDRHLLRLFADELGTTPARYVEQVRVEAARRLLERDDSGLASVARQSGLGSDETLRRVFRRRLGVTPEQYRHRFRVSTKGT